MIDSVQAPLLTVRICGWKSEKLTLKPSLRIKNKVIVTNQGATG